MKRHIASLLLALGLSSAAPKLALAYSGIVDNLFAVIPDGDLNGIQSSQTFTGIPGAVAHVSVTLNITGGINGDLYAYLFHNNTSAILLNRVGRTGTSGVGYANAGFGLDASLNSFTLDDQASQDVHLYQTFGYRAQRERAIDGTMAAGRAGDRPVVGGVGI